MHQQFEAEENSSQLNTAWKFDNFRVFWISFSIYSLVGDLFQIA